MSLSTLKKELDRIDQLTYQAESKAYTFKRVVNDDLIVTFSDGKWLKLPVIPLRIYQRIVQHELFIKQVKRFFLVRPRRAGKEVESWSMLVQAAIQDSGLYLMIYPTNVRARMVLWEGAIVMPDGSSKRFLDMIPKSMLAKKPNDQEMVIKLINGSIIWVLGSDIDPDKLRGVNARGVVCSEYAYSDPRVYHILMPMLRQNGGWVILQTTFNGQNHAWRYMQEVKNNPDWFCTMDSVETLVDEHGVRYVTDDMIEQDRRSGMPEYLIQQEYYSVVQLNQETLYFAQQINALYETEKVLPDLILPGKRVRAHFDLGWDDSTAVTLEQQDRNGNPIIIGYIEDNNKTFETYVRRAESFCNARGLHLDQNMYLPHDGQKKDLNTGRNTADFAGDLGYIAHIVPRPTSKINAIQSMRKMLYRTKFNKTHTERLIDCLSNYSKEFDAKKGVYKEEPKHDWTSHGVDSYQTMTLAYEAGLVNEQLYDVVYYNH